ncbi:hydroxyacid dehydrogenase [Bifidobacterium biavatii]|uniref:2-hydroxyacid dehydrogenase n=1 Tax=Bifidobacterium biavatii DSM 23969 TaxID=1437608 RepID=A0A087A4U4_9BIFI|nr:hydroxyacid dehydrogenase [Bifidobacterium biavatii]KFI53794.1 2-hydroxyacid dehydrogenase [Bifidobacterium biavatii DSM 23969]
MAESKPKVILTMQPPELVNKLMNDEQWARLEAVADVDREVIPDFHAEGVAERIKDADYVFSGWGPNGRIDAEVLAAMPNLKGVAAAAGNVWPLFTPDALEEAKKRGILRANSGYVNGIPVAEFCMAMILMADKDFFRAERIYRDRREYINREVEFPTAGNYHKTVGLVTASSRIGRHLMGLLKSYRLRVLAESRSMDEAETASYGAIKADLETVFRESDIVSLHTPNLPATHGMIDAKYFKMMKDGAWFLNSARGGVVNADDMIAELKTGRINAILDVTDPDEPLSPDSPLWDMPNVILTPHIAGSEGGELQAMGENVVNELTHMIKGEPLDYGER